MQVSHNVIQSVHKEFVVWNTSMFVLNDFAYMIASQGYDQCHLGCWSYFKTSGKNNLKTAVIICYCPVKAETPVWLILNTLHR